MDSTSSAPRGSLMVYASDLLGEGLEHVLDETHERAGLDGVSLGAVYHHAKDVAPHDPLHPVRFLDGGAFFFRPRSDAFEGQRIQPHLAGMLDELDPLGDLLTVARRRGLSVRAWTINCHNTTLGERYPECATRNAFGDAMITDLCPANPDVRAYVRTMSGELSRLGVDAILAESICYLPFDHGFHHERSIYPLSETLRFFLSLCFCDHCTAAARASGADVETIRSFARRQIREALEGRPNELDGTPLTREDVARLAAGEVEGLLTARERVVTGVIEEVTDAVKTNGEARFVFADSHGADDVAAQVGPSMADRAWRFGVDVTAVSSIAHGFAVMGYSRDNDRFRSDIMSYLPGLASTTELSVMMRAMPPDCLGPADLPPKLTFLESLPATWVDWYVYGLMRPEGLDWIRAARAPGA